MDKIIKTTAELRLADAVASKRLGNSEILMLRAGRAVAVTAVKLLPLQQPRCLVLCGAGNNGGDGLFAARELINCGWQVTVVLLNLHHRHLAKVIGIAAKQIIRFTASRQIDWQAYDIIIDGMIGSGLNRAITGKIAKAISAANQSAAFRLAIDIPSGIAGDSGLILGIALRANHTVTFTAATPGHYILPGKEYCGAITRCDIGVIAADFTNSGYRVALNHPDNWQSSASNNELRQNKYSRGKTLLLAGKQEYSGASKLAAAAALRSGSGLVTLVTERADSVAAVYGYAAVIINHVDQLPQLVSDTRITALAYGMGAGVSAATRARTQLLLATHKPCVVDADALTSFSGQFEVLQSYLHEKVVLTPHQGEFTRLFPSTITKAPDRLQQARLAAAKSRAVVVLKGNDTIIAEPHGAVYINYTAPPWLATAGSGDVLTGIIAGQLATGQPPFLAAARGVWLHSQAALTIGRGLIADDLITGLAQLSSGKAGKQALMARNLWL